MVIYFGADHKGFELKEALKQHVAGMGYEVADLGNAKYEEGDDYPIFAEAVGEKVGAAPEYSRGVVICGSGAGVDIVANKFKNVRSVLAISVDQVYDARHDDDVNVLAIAADFTSPENAQGYVDIFLQTPFASDEKYRRRLGEIEVLENPTTDTP